MGEFGPGDENIDIDDILVPNSTELSATSDSNGDIQVGGPLSPVSWQIYIRREDTRREIALLLLAVFALEALGALASQFGTHPVQIKEILEVVFAPTVALLGSAVGFYYGTK